MNEYGQHITTHNPAPLLSTDSAKEKKEARKKLLDEIFRRRAENYKQLMEKKRRLQSNGAVI